jgi:hypothetical protein
MPTAEMYDVSSALIVMNVFVIRDAVDPNVADPVVE